MAIYGLLKGTSFTSTFGSPGFSASYIIQTENENVLFDTGHNGQRNLLIRSLQKLNLNPRDIDIVVLSHDHWDHVMNYSIFEHSKFIIGKSRPRNGIRDWAYVPFLEDRLRSMDSIFLKNSDPKEFGSFKIIRVPGHTEGHLAMIVVEGHNVNMFTGDAIPSLNSYKLGKPDLIFYSKEQAIKSFKEMLNFRPFTIFPGHDTPFQPETMTYVSKKNYLEISITGNTELKIASTQ